MRDCWGWSLIYIVLKDCLKWSDAWLETNVKLLNTNWFVKRNKLQVDGLFKQSNGRINPEMQESVSIPTPRQTWVPHAPWTCTRTLLDVHRAHQHMSSPLLPRCFWTSLRRVRSSCTQGCQQCRRNCTRQSSPRMSVSGPPRKK